MWVCLSKERAGIVHGIFISVQDRDRKLSAAMMDSSRQTPKRVSEPAGYTDVDF